VNAAAAWFKPNALHPLERAALPEYFSGKNAETGVKVSAPGMVTDVQWHLQA
jgi:hypothetical protein